MAELALTPELLAQVRRIQVRTDRMVTDVMAGGYSSVFRGSGIEFDEVREFAEGDDLRSVDWNVTARVGRPFVKKFVEERELSVLFVLDGSPSMAFGTMPPGRDRRTVAATAAMFVGCLAFAAARNNDKAGLIAFGDRVDRYVPCKKGRSHVLRLIREAFAVGLGSAAAPATKRATAGAASSGLAQALDYAGRVQRRHAVVFVISDFFASDHERPLRLLPQRHDVVAVRIRDPYCGGILCDRGDVPELPNAGLLQLRDPETGRLVLLDTGSKRVRQAYRAAVLQERTAMRDACRRAGVDLLDIPTEGSVADPIVRFFRMREARGARR